MAERITYERLLRNAEVNKAAALMRIADALEAILAHLTKAPPPAPTAPKEIPHG